MRKSPHTKLRSHTTVPSGGDGQSARCSRIFYLPADCPIKLNGQRPSGTRRWFREQVTRIGITEEVYSREYGHDKSYCAQDSTTGIASWNGTITTFMQCNRPAITLHAGQIAWIEVYPLGTGRADAKICGYALIKTADMSMNLENGDPVGRNYTYKSKGWWNVPSGVSGTFDCCHCCEEHGGGGSGGQGSGGGSGGSGGGGSGGGSQAVVEAVSHTPVTAYQWKDGVWNQVYDECDGEYVHGPMPTEPPTEGQADLKFVECVLAD